MKKLVGFLVAAVLCLTSVMACAGGGGWSIPSRGGSQSGSFSNDSFSGISVRLIDDLATRSGPSTEYTGCGSYKMKGQYVTALSRRYDNGGVLWIEIEFSYGGGYRRAWTGAKRLDISSSQLSRLPEEDPRDYLGYGTVNGRVSPRFGPGTLYASYSDRDYHRGDQVLILACVNDYYLTECYMYDGSILRSWLSASDVNMQ